MQDSGTSDACGAADAKSDDAAGPPSPEPAGPSILFILPWQPRDGRGVDNIVVNLHRRAATSLSLRPALLASEYPHWRPTPVANPLVESIILFKILDPRQCGEGFKAALSFLLRAPANIARLARLLRQRQVRIVNIHYPTPAVAIVLMTRLLTRLLTRGRFAIVLSFHGADLQAWEGDGWFARRLAGSVLERCDGIATCSRALSERLSARHPGIAGRIRTVHNAIEVGASERSAQAHRPPALDGRAYIVCVGTFEAKKAHDVALRAFETIAESRADIDLVLIGRVGPTYEAVRAAAGASRHDARIHLLVDQAHGDTLAAIAGAKVLVLPSRDEPFGLVILEAGALGTPVVASRVGGIPEVIEDGRTGLLVAPDSPAELAEAVLGVLADPARAALLAGELAAEVRARFTWDRALSAYGEIIAAAGRSRR